MPKTWQEVEYYDQVVRDSKRTGRAMHLGRLFDICVLKGSELPAGHPNRESKGRVVFGCNNVQDEHGLAATFPDAGSGASYASASKLLDTVARLPGCVGEQSDAPAAYTQADMYEEDIEDNDTPTYVQLPEWQWNDAMREAHRRTGRRPVCRLLWSLYGHPSAGLFWERKYKMVLRAAGFKEMTGWERMFYHDVYKVVLSVYVDDFKMAGTADGVKAAWKSITGPDRLVLDPPERFGPYLGCQQTWGTITRQEAAERVQNIFLLVSPTAATGSDWRDPNGKVPMCTWSMKGFFKHCIEKYLELRKANGCTARLKGYTFPSTDDHQIPPDSTRFHLRSSRSRASCRKTQQQSHGDPIWCSLCEIRFAVADR